MVKPSKATKGSITLLSRRNSNILDSLFASTRNATKLPILFVAVVVGMSCLAITLRMREQNDVIVTNSLMTIGSDIGGGAGRVRKTRQHPQFNATWDIYQRIEAEQTGRVREPAKNPQPNSRVVNFVQHQQLAENDAFSASWLQQRESFLTMNLDGIGICEDAAFFAYKDERHENLKMTVDWLDFSVEHMSKWYTMIDPMENDIPYSFAVGKLEEYLKRGSQYPIAKELWLKETIAVIAFIPTSRNTHHPEKARNLSVLNLAATVESLRRAGMGRVVVIGMEEEDREYANEAFKLVHLSIGDQSEPEPGGVKRVGHMELEFARGHSGHAKNDVIKNNVPRATLMGLRDAFNIQKRGDGDHDSIVTMKTWLGDHNLDHWKYVYLTEPDTILATRPSTLETLKKNVDEGSVLIPWRLQPIPHESDLRGCLKTDRYLVEADGFQEVVELDSLADSPDMCCDELKGPNHKPGLPPNFPDCGNFWYMCGFAEAKPDDPNPHERLKAYKLIRLKQGTQFTHLSSLEHGRPCTPVKSESGEVCKAPAEN